MATVGHRYELHRSTAVDEQERKMPWCIYDYFDVNGGSGLSFWYYYTKREALKDYPDASLEFA